MNSSTVLLIFVGATAVAVTLQMVILFLLYKAVSQSAAKVESLANQVQLRAIPLLESTAAILEDAQPKISEITTNLAETSAIVRERAEHISLATGEVIERARLQVIRLDDLVNSTADKVEQTTEFLQNAVFAPIRRVQAIIQAVSAGLNFFRRSRKMGKVHPMAVEEDEEMFI
ncbi:MAG: hypothetical protein LAP21_23625 [Acidobacteriia bacterium]|nr:hypothetical protein [Terriglobia bacterium]